MPDGMNATEVDSMNSNGKGVGTARWHLQPIGALGIRGKKSPAGEIVKDL